MKILVVCEFSGSVSSAFRNQNHEAFSCDLLSSDNIEDRKYHFQDDYKKVFNYNNWDIIIGHPPCTAISVSGNRWYSGTNERIKAIEFVKEMADLFDKHASVGWAIENPVGVLSSQWQKPSQYIQPYQFGHPESKKTGLWLNGLPLLKSTKELKKPTCGYWNNQTPSGQNKLGPSLNRWKERSKTYSGIAKAMAVQWG